MKRALLLLSLLLSLVACKAPETPAAKAQATSWPAASAADGYFPLEAGRMYHYVTEEAGDTGMLVANVGRTDATHGELRIGKVEKHFVYDAKGVAYEGGAYVLQVPLEVGTSWPGEHGGTTRITSVDAHAAVPAGSYGSCIETVEEVVPAARYTNVYCPGIGLVTVEVTTPRGSARIALKRYGTPVEI